MPDMTQTITSPHEQIAALRAARGETLEAFGALIGVSSKGRMSEIERGLRVPTPEQSLEIERIAEGEIDASGLNPIIAAARGVEWPSDHGGIIATNPEPSSPGKPGGEFPASDEAA